MFLINVVKIIIIIGQMVFCITLDSLRSAIRLAIIVYFKYHRMIRKYITNKIDLRHDIENAVKAIMKDGKKPRYANALFSLKSGFYFLPHEKDKKENGKCRI